MTIRDLMEIRDLQLDERPYNGLLAERFIPPDEGGETDPPPPDEDWIAALIRKLQGWL